MKRKVWFSNFKIFLNIIFQKDDDDEDEEQ
jgi:hypothetical protein